MVTFNHLWQHNSLTARISGELTEVKVTWIPVPGHTHSQTENSKTKRNEKTTYTVSHCVIK